VLGDPIDPHKLHEALASLNWSGPSPIVLAEAQCLNDDFVLRHVALPPSTDDTLASVVIDHVHSANPSAGAGVHLTAVVSGGGEAGWLPLAITLAVSDAIGASAHIPVEVEWPSTLSIPGAMCGGSAGSKQVGTITHTITKHTAVIGISVDALTGVLELKPGTTSLLAAGGSVDREQLIAHILVAARDRLHQWRNADPTLRTDYRARCRTVGQLVDGGWISGIDERGELSVTSQ